MNIDLNMLEILITAIVSVGSTGFFGWLIFFKWKRGALISKLARETAEERMKLYQLLDKRITEMGLEIYQQKERELTMRAHIGALFRACDCNETEEIIAIKKLYE